MKRNDLIKNASVVTISVFLIAIGVYASTTISTNITTGGNLTTGGNATTSGYFIVGTTNPTWDLSAGDVLIGGRALIGNAATSTNYFATGAPTINSLGGLASGDTAIGGALEVDSDAFFNGTTMDFGTTTATTTNGLFVHPGTNAATTTVSIGQTADTGIGAVAGCLELVANADNPVIYHCYISGATLACATGRCTD